MGGNQDGVQNARPEGMPLKLRKGNGQEEGKGGKEGPARKIVAGKQEHLLTARAIKAKEAQARQKDEGGYEEGNMKKHTLTPSRCDSRVPPPA